MGVIRSFVLTSLPIVQFFDHPTASMKDKDIGMEDLALNANSLH